MFEKILVLKPLRGGILDRLSAPIEWIGTIETQRHNPWHETKKGRQIRSKMVNAACQRTQR